MSSIIKHGSAHWEGAIKTGKGTVSTQSGALNQQPYGFNTRFEGQSGTNPEELLGAAHAACFSMALSLILGDAGFTATSIDTQADVSLSKTDGGFEITSIALTLRAKVPNATQQQFTTLANKAKEGCPVSKLFRAAITLDATLIA
ncbi:OsmC family protein [Acetobacter fabarum]|uniref:OsmC family protein n=1 Tax=Acetobacter fabarum TaxID=483199 RepID=UPI00312B40BF